MTLADVEVQNGFLVTFKSLLNHLSTSLRPNPSLILHMARSAGAGGGEASISKLASRSASLSRQSLPRKCCFKEERGVFVCCAVLFAVRRPTMTILIEI